MDNFYNSYQLTEELLKKDSYSTGALRKERNGNYFSKEINEAMLRGETIARYSNKNIMIGKQKNKRDVLFISTDHKNELVEYADKGEITIHYQNITEFFVKNY